MLGVFVTRFAAGFFTFAMPAGSIAIPLVALGITLGSAAGGLLFNVAVLPGASFVLTAGLTVLGFMLSLGLPHLLAPPNS